MEITPNVTIDPDSTKKTIVVSCRPEHLNWYCQELGSAIYPERTAIMVLDDDVTGAVSKKYQLEDVHLSCVGNLGELSAEGIDQYKTHTQLACLDVSHPAFEPNLRVVLELFMKLPYDAYAPSILKSISTDSEVFGILYINLLTGAVIQTQHERPVETQN